MKLSNLRKVISSRKTTRILKAGTLAVLLSLSLNAIGLGGNTIPQPIPSINVNALGKPEMSFSIQLPSAAKDFVPPVGLNYSPSNGNGLLGEGWSLNAVQYIARNPRKGIHFDGDGYVSSGK